MAGETDTFGGAGGIGLETDFAALWGFVREQREAEASAVRLAARFLPLGALNEPGPALDDLAYVGKNIFSILFLAIFASLGIPPERRAAYALLNHAIRGIVTATDNILDDETKSLLPLVLPKGAPRFTAVMNILLYDRMVEAAVSGFIPAKREAFTTLLTSMLFKIGEVEAEEEGGLGMLAPPAEVLARVHGERGGNLLKLAFAAPLVFEEVGTERIIIAAEGVHKIGMALQMIDDVVDLAEDCASLKNNYLLARLLAFPDARSIASGGWPNVLAAHPELLAEAVGRAHSSALDGFALLGDTGFPLDREGAGRLIRALFDLRGGGELFYAVNLPAP